MADSWTEYREHAGRTLQRARELVAQSEGLRARAARLAKQADRAIERARAAMQHSSALSARPQSRGEVESSRE